MRSIWAGAISFGMVVIPVKLYAATEQRDVAFRQVHREDGGRIQFRRVCSVDGQEVAYAVSEPLRAECQAFLDAVATRTPPLTDGASGLRVLKVLQMAQRSVITNGSRVAVAEEAYA